MIRTEIVLVVDFHTILLTPASAVMAIDATGSGELLLEIVSHSLGIDADVKALPKALHQTVASCSRGETQVVVGCIDFYETFCRIRGISALTAPLQLSHVW